MKYYVAEFTLSCVPELFHTAQELLADAAGVIGFEAFEDTPNGLKGYIQTDIFNKETLDEEIKHFLLPHVTISYTISSMEDKNWNEEWEKHGFEPLLINNHIVIYDAKRDFSPQQDKINIAIDAQQAFGTGNHETTRMIVSQLDHLDLNGKSILDCGCGTGILSIASMKLGATQAVGYDIDEWSVNNCRHNAQLNGIKNIQVLHGNAKVLTHINGVFDVILANINRNILLNDMPSFKDVMSKDGIIIMSGFYSDDIPVLAAKAHEIGLTITHQQSEGNWACIILSRI